MSPRCRRRSTARRRSCRHLHERAQPRVEHGRVVGLAELGRQGHTTPWAEKLTDDERVVAELAGVEVLPWADLLRDSLEPRSPVLVVLLDRCQGVAALEAPPVLLAVRGGPKTDGSASR